jgi:hypothetical protein
VLQRNSRRVSAAGKQPKASAASATCYRAYRGHADSTIAFQFELCGEKLIAKSSWFDYSWTDFRNDALPQRIFAV